METLRRAKNRRRFAMSLPSVDGLGIELHVLHRTASSSEVMTTLCMCLQAERARSRVHL